MCMLEAVDLSSTHRSPVTRILPLSRPPRTSIRPAFLTPQLSPASSQPTLKPSSPSVAPQLSLKPDQPSLKPVALPVISHLSLKLDQPLLRPSVPLVIPRLSLGLDEPSPKPSALSIAPHLSLGSAQPVLKISSSPVTPQLSSDCETESKQSQLRHSLGEQLMQNPVLPPSVVEPATLKPSVVVVAPQLSLDSQRDKAVQKLASHIPSQEVVGMSANSSMAHTTLPAPLTLPPIVSISIASQPTAVHLKEIPQVHIANNLSTKPTFPEENSLSAETRTNRLGVADDTSLEKCSEPSMRPENLSVEISRDPASVGDNSSVKQTDVHCSGEAEVECESAGEVVGKLAASSRSRSAVVADSLPADVLCKGVKNEARPLPGRSIVEPLLRLTVPRVEHVSGADKNAVTAAISATDNVTSKYIRASQHQPPFCGHCTHQPVL